MADAWIGGAKALIEPETGPDQALDWLMSSAAAVIRVDRSCGNAGIVRKQLLAENEEREGATLDRYIARGGVDVTHRHLRSVRTTLKRK